MLFTASTFLSVTTEMLPTGLLTAMSRDLHASEARVGILVTGYALMVALFAAPLGRATARIRRRVLFTGALAGYAASNVLMAVATVYPVAAVARLTGGLTHGLFWAMLAGYIARMVDPARLGRAMTLVFTGGTLAILLGVPAGTALGVAVGWRMAFVVLAAVSLLLVLLGWRILPDLPGADGADELSLLQVLRTPAVTVVVLTTAVTMLGFFSFFTYISPFLLHAGVSEQGLSPVLLGYGVAGAVGLFVTGLLIDKRPRVAMLGGAVLLTGALALMAVGRGSVPLAVIGACLAGMALNSQALGVQAATLRAAPAGATDTASALNASAFNIGIGGGALAGGLVLDSFGVAALPLVAAVLTGIGLVGVAAGRRNGFPATVPL
ncbi:MFS transporter [Catellatospora sp. TT07R-123]|nr:MFS transporter [Catellatospora sp. TT07R-123]